MNHLELNNCNKSKCKTCIFGNTPIELSIERINEIHGYLSRFESSHVCHTTNKTCYGALEFQAKILHAMKIIDSPTVDNLLQTAKQYINGN